MCPWDFPGKNTGVGCHLGDLPHPGTESVSCVSPALAGGFFTTEPPGKPNIHKHIDIEWASQVVLVVKNSRANADDIRDVSFCWAYTPRKPELKEMRVPQCSSQHCL